MRDGGVFIAFEGGEGSGKSTQIKLLAEALRARGHDVLVTHEPGATEVGSGIRELVLHHRQPLSPRAEALLFAADRAHHVDTVIRPALEPRQIVLTDRYVDSSLAYQGVGRDLTIDEIRRLSRWATQDLGPDLTVLLDVPATIGLARARGDGAGDKLESESLDSTSGCARRSCAWPRPSRGPTGWSTRPVRPMKIAAERERGGRARCCHPAASRRRVEVTS